MAMDSILKRFRRSSSTEPPPSPTTPKAPRIRSKPLPTCITEDGQVLEDEEVSDGERGTKVESDRPSTPISPISLITRKRKGSLLIFRSETPQSRCESRSSSSSYPQTPIFAPTPRRPSTALHEEGWKRCDSPVGRAYDEERKSTAVPAKKHELTSPRPRATPTSPTSLPTPAPSCALRERALPSLRSAATEPKHTTPDGKRRRRSSPDTLSPPAARPSTETFADKPLPSEPGSAKPPLKGILKSTPRSRPRSVPIHLHWQLLPYDPTICKKKLLFDVALPVDFMRDVTRKPGLKLGTSVMNKLASSTPLTSMRMQCRQLPHWDILVANPEGITCGDVYHAIYESFRTALTPKERKIYVTQRHHEAVYEAFELRCRDTPELDEVVRQQGLRRVDLLEGKRIFIGLSRPPDSDEYWVLDVGYPASD